MVQGATYLIPVNIDVNLNYVDSIIFTLKCGETKVQKEYPSQTNFLKNGNIGIPLNQYETTVLQGLVKIEAQINYKEGRVAKTETDVLQISHTLATKFIDGSESTEPDLDPLLLNTSDPVVAVSGATFIPSVSEDGVISWTNDGDLTNPTPINIKGPKGDKGDQGTPGQRGEKGEKGDQGIPGEKGAKGDKGDKGDTGAQGIQGIQGVKGDTGAQGATGAKGDKGDPGEPGAKGDKGDPGDTPYIGENGNWFIGDTDTETSASGTPDAVQYVPQTLTPDQQTQARRNIDAQSQVYAVKRANPWSAEDCVSAPIRGLKLYGASEQDGTPTPENPIEVKSNDLIYTLYGRNLINISNIQEQTDTGLTIKYLPDEGCIMLNGTASSSKLRFRNILKIEIGVGTPITFSLSYISGETTIPEGKYSVFYVGESDTETAGNFIDVNLSKNNTSKTKYSTKRYIVDAWTYIEQGVTFSNYKFRIQAEIGNTVNPYTPYFYGGSITAPSLYGIGDAQDEWDAMTGHGVRRIKKVVYTGNENWQLPTYIVDGYSSYRVHDTIEVGKKEFICSHFVAEPNVEYFNPIIKNRITSYKDTTQIIVQVSNDIADSLNQTTTENWKAYLAAQYSAGTPVTVYCELVKPEPFETMPVEQITMPDGYAQFLPSGDGAAGDVETEYAVDIEKRYVPKETYTALEERVAALELVAIEG